MKPNISALVFQEAGKGDPDQARMRLVAVERSPMHRYRRRGPLPGRQDSSSAGCVPSEYPEDAFYIAVAAVNGMEVILPWNFAHLNNPFTRKLVRQVVEGEGYECPEICSPEELLEVDK